MTMYRVQGWQLLLAFLLFELVLVDGCMSWQNGNHSAKSGGKIEISFRFPLT